MGSDWKYWSKKEWSEGMGVIAGADKYWRPSTVHWVEVGLVEVSSKIESSSNRTSERGWREVIKAQSLPNPKLSLNTTHFAWLKRSNPHHFEMHKISNICCLPLCSAIQRLHMPSCFMGRKENNPKSLQIPKQSITNVLMSVPLCKCSLHESSLRPTPRHWSLRHPNNYSRVCLKGRQETPSNLITLETHLTFEWIQALYLGCKYDWWHRYIRCSWLSLRLNVNWNSCDSK